MMNFNQLKKLSKFEKPEDIQDFEREVWALAATKDPKVLTELMDLFDDECAYSEVMYSLVHAIETYPDDVYVKSLLQQISKGLNFYPEWIERLVNRIFNAPNCLICFRNNIHFVDIISLLILFDLMEKESPQHQQLILDLRKDLNF